MFIGHFAIRLYNWEHHSRSSNPYSTNWSSLPDIWPILILTCVEKVKFDKNKPLQKDIVFESYPISHSLVLKKVFYFIKHFYKVRINCFYNFYLKNRCMEETFMNTLPAEQTWMILVELLTDLKKKGIEIPSNVTKDIQMAKTTINFYKTDPNDPERMKELKRINDFLNSIQDILLTFADDISDDYSKIWLEKLKKASRGEEVYKIDENKPKFVVGAPSGFSIARLTFKKPILEERLQDVAENYNIIIEFEEDNIILLYGDKENIKKSLKNELASFFTE